MKKILIALIILILLIPSNQSEKASLPNIPSREDIIGFLFALEKRAKNLQFVIKSNVGKELLEKTGNMNYVFNDTSLKDAIIAFYDAINVSYNESSIEEFISSLNFSKEVSDAIALIMFSYVDVLNAKSGEEQIDALLITFSSIRKASYVLLNYSLNESKVDPYGKICFGSTKSNVFEKNLTFIIDFGGDDKYIARNNSFILDLKGNDKYENQSAIYGINILYDLYGNDTHFDASYSYGGINSYFDLEGNDKYYGNTAVSYNDGMSFLIDMKGNDIYKGNAYTQAFSKGGISLLFDFMGEDVYNASLFSQASSIEGIAILLDAYGNDVFKAKDYSQAFADGMSGRSISLFLNLQGDDLYMAGNYSQGYAEDLAISVFLDVLGADNYKANKFSQASAILGLAGLIDVDGIGKFAGGFASQGYKMGGISFFMKDVDPRGNENIIQLFDYLNFYFRELFPQFI